MAKTICLGSGLITAMYTLDQGESLIIAESEETNKLIIDDEWVTEQIPKK